MALCEWLDVAPGDIRSQKNKEKYYDPENRFVAGPELEEVFGLMKGLNQAALRDDGIAAAKDGGGCFRETLAQTARDIARRFAGQEFLYVELGPEPAKTVFIIDQLLRHGARIRGYVGVDINPASNQAMREALSGHLATERVGHRISSFDRFAVDDIRQEGVPALVTTLGFQEGNEDPESLPALYRRLLGSGDLLLSEMQLRPDLGWQPVQSFYHHPFMRRFSRIAFERVFGGIPSQGGFALLRVGSFAGEDLWAAVLYEMPYLPANAASAAQAEASSGALPRVFITNYCLKYSSRQFHELRRSSQCQEILAQRLTGDRSVAFQLSRRT